MVIFNTTHNIGPSDMALLTVRTVSGQNYSLTIELSATVAQAKEKLVESTGVPVEQQRLIYKGRVLKDEETLSSYGTVTLPLDVDV